MKKPVRIWNARQTHHIDVPVSCMRLCAQCLSAMHLDHYHWSDEKTVELVWLCEHTQTSRFKRVTAELNPMGDLQCIQRGQ